MSSLNDASRPREAPRRLRASLDLVGSSRVITEQICVDVVRALYGRSAIMRSALNLDDAPGAKPHESETRLDHALPPSEAYRQLLPHYPLDVLETTLR